MASTPFLLTYFVLFTIISTLSIQISNASFVLPIIKDNKMSQYYTTFLVGSHPSTRVYLGIDLANRWSWFTCGIYGYDSTTFGVSCKSPKCWIYAGPWPICGDFLCVVEPRNPWSNKESFEELFEDTMSLYKQTQPNSLTKLSKVGLPNFPFSCSTDKHLLSGLSPHTKGILTLTRAPGTLHSHISSTFKVARKFSLCLPSSTLSGYNGAIYFGSSPEYMSKSLIITPLLVNPNTTSNIHYLGFDPSIEYFIKVRSIRVEGTSARFRSSLLSFDKDGVGGTKISTTDPYTVLHSEIYKALLDVFIAKAATMKMTRVSTIAPFGACFSAESVVVDDKNGPIVPIIDMILDGKSPLLHNKNARWRIYGANSMVKVSMSVWCLGVVDGGVEPRTAIVIGGKQMEDNLVEIDLESSKLGVTSSLLRTGTSCSTFKGI